MVEEVGSETPVGERTTWAMIRADYEARALTVNAICRRYGVTLPQLLDRARANKWRTERPASIDRRILINQLLGVLERQIEHLDVTLPQTGEKEVAVLNKLAMSLEKLIAMDKAEAGCDDEGETDEIRDIRVKLAKRIDALTKA